MRVASLLLAALLAAPVAFAAPKDEELARARVLDQQGVRAYKDGRYNDAIRYFSEAFKLGGPPSELWNIAKCHMRLDQPDQASDAYDRYLMQPGLSQQDKAEARSELEELKQRRSILTVASAPSRSAVFVDGKRNEPAGMTPFSVQLGPGTHKVEVEQRGYKPYTEEVEAKFGRAIIVDAQLERDPKQALVVTTTPDKPDKPDKPEKPARRAGAYDAARRFTAKGEADVVLSKLGSYAQGARAGFGLGAAYWIVDTPDIVFGAGLRAHFTSDAWGNTINATPNGAGCGTAIPNNETANEFSVFGVALLGYRVTPRLRVGMDAGLGLAWYDASVLGSDLFYPTCQPTPGTQPAAHAGLEVSYALIPNLRVYGAPLNLEIHPSYSGARPNPVDATGAWLRLGIGLGLAVDL
jgi:hypothetical protein